MTTRLLTLLMGTVFLAGCATTAAKPQPITQLQAQVSDLQQRVEEQEKEIVDLKYEVKEISDKAAARMAVPLEESEPLPKSSKPAALSGQIIKVNATGIEVQSALAAAGVYSGKIDGQIGSKTKAAIVEFQRQHNLKADGVVGQRTWTELKEYLSE